MNEIHTVTTIPHHPNDPRGHTFAPRCWGYQFTREAALKMLHGNCDDEAGYYTHAVVERYGPGAYGLACQEEWYVRDEHTWLPCDQPEWARHVVNYAMG